MDKETLINKLIALDIKPSEYSLDGDLLPDTIILYQNYSKWEVFYLDERGGRDMQNILDTQESAYDYIYALFFDIYTTRRKFNLNY